MKVYKTQAQVEKDIKNGVLAIDGDVRFECSINIEASINARNINARDITAWDITAWDISYYAFCGAYQSIKCTNIKSERQKAQEPICLDGQLEIKPKEDEDVERAIKLLEEKGRLKDGKILS